MKFIIKKAYPFIYVKIEDNNTSIDLGILNESESLDLIKELQNTIDEIKSEMDIK